MSRGVAFWLAVLLVFSGGAAMHLATRGLGGTSSGSSAPEHAAGGADQVIPDRPTMDGFQLTDQQGNTFDSESLRGKVWVASFFFTSCPGPCMMQNQRVATLQSRFGPRGLKLVSITCDPHRDTPSRLRDYAGRFQADSQKWVFLTGDLKYIENVGANFFQVPVGKQTHGSHLIVFDQQGEMRGAFGATNTESFDRLNKLLDELLPQSPEQ